MTYIIGKKLKRSCRSHLSCHFLNSSYFPLFITRLFIDFFILALVTAGGFYFRSFIKGITFPLSLFNCTNKKRGVMNMWFRLIMIGFFSLTASRLFLFQGIEIYQAFSDLIRNK